MEATPVAETPAPAPVTEAAPAPKEEEFRPQVPCSKCSAPNDTFAKICWMCKQEFIAKLKDN